MFHVVKMTNPVFVYDFTLPECDREIVENWLKDKCKKWCFQLEQGEKSGYRHYQGRFSLKVKDRLSTLINKTKNVLKGIHLSITSDENKDNNFYVMKEDTRLDGPWTEEDVVEIPRQFRIEKLYPWQQYIYDHYDDWDTRHINVVLDKGGNIGKSTFVGWMCTRKLSQKIPPAEDFKDIMRIIMDTPKRRIYFIDMPRAFGERKKLGSFMAGIEDLKNGWCYDDRYKYQECWFDSPNIWMFTNELPDSRYLSNDRWVYWRVINNELVRYIPSQETELGKYI